MDTAELASSLRSIISSLHKGLRKKIYSSNALSITELETIRHLIQCTSLLPTELASLVRIKTQSMSQVLKKMEAQAVITRTPSDKDKRKVYISLTESGKALVEKSRYDRDEWLKGIIEKSLTDKEIKVLSDALPVLNKLIETR